MKINGVDPVVIEQVKEQVTQPVVREARETRITREYREQEFRQGQGRREDFPGSLSQALEQLNQVCQSMRIRWLPSCGQSSGAKVEIVDLRKISNQGG